MEGAVGSNVPDEDRIDDEDETTLEMAPGAINYLADFRHGFRQPFFVNDLAEVRCHPCAVHLEHFPGFFQDFYANAEQLKQEEEKLREVMQDAAGSQQPAAGATGKPADGEPVPGDGK